MKQSLLSCYVQSLRAQRGYSIDDVARFAKIEKSEYLRYEDSPETARSFYHPKILNILCLDSVEYLNFQIIAGLVRPPDVYENSEFRLIQKGSPAERLLPSFSEPS